MSEISELKSFSKDIKGKIIFDSKYPDGSMKKNLNSSIIRSLGWKPKTSLLNGLKKSIEFYVKTK